MGIIEIEKKHCEYFREKTPINQFERVDRLESHYLILIQKENKLFFNFINESDLKNEIRDEVEDLFKNVWQ